MSLQYPGFLKKLSLLLLVLFLTIPRLHAQLVQDPTEWRYEVRKKGDNKYQLVFHVKLTKPDWHIYSLNPGGDGTLIPPSFTFKKGKDYKLVGKVKEANGKRVTEDIEGVGTVHYFKNSVDFVQEVTVTGNTKITGSHEYQVCNDQMCLPPTSLPFSFDITDATAATGGNDTAAATVAGTDGETNPDTAALADNQQDEADTTGIAVTGLTPPSGPALDGGDETAAAPAKGAGVLFLTGLGNGLLSVITPCVFAMLPMTVSFFLKRSKDRKTGIKIALQYSVSIILIFTLIGGLFSIFFGPDALHAFSTNWIVNMAFFAIFLIFGISFLGAFEINLPSSWATKLDTKANTRNFMGIFFMALTLVVVSFSCTVPFIGNLVVSLQSGGKMAPLMGFLGFGVGLALPFSLFAIFPSLLNELGKSGGWLNAVKVTFGFIELALAMKFLSNADLTMGWRLLDREIFIAIWATLSFVLGLYLLGVIRFSHDSEMPKNDWGLPYLKVPRLFFALSAIIFAIYLIPGMWGAPLRGMGAFVPPMGTQDFVMNQAAPGVMMTGNTQPATPRRYADRMSIYEPAAVLDMGMEVYFDYNEALEASRRENKPVMLDFTGINCVNCRKFESEVWSHPEVKQLMKHEFIVASLFTDASMVKIPESEQTFSKVLNRKIETLGQQNVDLQVSKFNSNTQPNYFFVDEQGNKLLEEAISYPTAPEKFASHLRAAIEKYKERQGALTVR